MEILFFITLTLLLVALFFVWKFWRERNAYKAAYVGTLSFRPSFISSVGPVLAAYVVGLIIGKRVLGSNE